MSTSYDFKAHWDLVSEIANEPRTNIRPQIIASDVQINAPTLLQTILSYRIQQNFGLVISRIEAYVHSVNTQSVVSAFDVAALITIQNSTGKRFFTQLANCMRDNDVLFTFSNPDTVQLVFSEISGPATFDALFRWYAWLVPLAKIGNFANVNTLLF